MKRQFFGQYLKQSTAPYCLCPPAAKDLSQAISSGLLKHSTMENEALNSKQEEWRMRGKKK